MTDFVVNTVPCKGCGKPILFAKTSQGKAIPLDPRAPIYAVHVGQDYHVGGPLEGNSCERAGQDPDGTLFMVSHFATCPKAADFSSSKKKVAP